MKDYAASIRARLYNLSQREGIWFNFLTTRYFHERLLFRLSRSQYADNFCLKGGALLYALEGISARQTRDLDLLGRRISNLLCTDRNETMVRYAIGGLDERVFVSQYRLHLPAEQELQGFLEREQAQMTKQQARRRKKSGKDE